MTAHGPLTGRRIVVTRPRHQATTFVAALEARGALPVLFPTIEIVPIAGNSDLDDALRRLDEYDWVVFTSVNGVVIFVDRLREVASGWKQQSSIRFAAIGPATADALTQRGFTVSFTPEEFIAERIADGMGDVTGRRILLARARRARDALRRVLEHSGASVEEIPVYDTRAADPDAASRDAVLAGVDVVTFTSASTVEHFMEILGADARSVLERTTVACIGPITAHAAERAGVRPDVVATVYTTEGLVDAMSQHLSNGSAQEEVDAGPLPPDPSVVRRPRRLRATPTMRRLLRETTVGPDDFIYPLFVDERHDGTTAISSMPGVSRYGLDVVAAETESVLGLGVPAVLLFGLPAAKDSLGSGSYADEGVIQRAIAAIKNETPDAVVVTDVCLCEYTDHGHCGLVNGSAGVPHRASLPDGYVLNDETLDVLARIAVSHAEAGADIVAPSGMIDGMVGVIRDALDANGFEHVAILSYAVKYASAFYGPFREAAEGAPKSGDRKSHQMDPGNAREAFEEVRLDLAQGADMVMVKPALSYLDVVSQTREAFPEAPLAAYNVSGEYSMVKAAAAAGWLEERATVLEIVTSMKRAGADVIVSYHAKDVAHWLSE